MAKFKFKFETVERVKQNLEKKVERDLALVNYEIQTNQKELDDLEKEKNELRENAVRQVKIKASEIKAQMNYESYLEAVIEEKKKLIEALEKKREEVLIDLTEKKKDVKIFDTLKGKHLVEHIKQENKNEQIFIDEIAGKKNKEDL